MYVDKWLVIFDNAFHLPCIAESSEHARVLTLVVSERATTLGELDQEIKLTLLSPKSISSTESRVPFPFHQTSSILLDPKRQSCKCCQGWRIHIHVEWRGCHVGHSWWRPMVHLCYSSFPPLNDSFIVIYIPARLCDKVSMYEFQSIGCVR